MTFARALPGLAALVLPAALAAAPPAPVDPAEAVRDAVRAAYGPALPQGATLEIVQLPRFPESAADDASLEAEPPAGPVGAGVRPVAVSRRVDGRIVARGLATVHIRREVPIWVAARGIAKGAAVADGDVTIETRTFDREPTREQTGAFEPGRWIARRALAAGDVLRATDLRRRPDVESGAPLNLVVRAGDARIAVPSTARRAGNVGETILVSNPVTGALVSAVLVDRGTAELTRPAAAGTAPASSGGDAP